MLEGEEVVEEKTLPSDIEEQQEEKKTYEELESELNALKEKNEKAEDIAKRLKDEKSQDKRQESKEAEQRHIKEIQNSVMTEVLTEAIESGGLSDEMISKAEEAGIDQRDLKIKMFEAKEQQASIERIAYESAGGKESYFNMVDIVKEGATEEETNAFQIALSNPATAKIAVLALKQRYQEKTGGVSTDNRITTTVSNTSTNSGGYADEASYFKDKRAANKLTGQAREDMMAKISAKLKKSSIGR